MTIDRINNNWKLDYAMKITAIGITIGFLVLVFLYNQTVDLRSSIKTVSAVVSSLQVENADLKNTYYSILDSENLIAVAGKLGLVKDRNPEYLNLGATATTDTKVVLSTNLGE